MLKSENLSYLLPSALIVILSIAGIIFAFAGGPPVGATGSVIFGQQSCAQAGCHSGLAVNSSAGSLTLAGVPANYTLGQSYDLTHHDQPAEPAALGFPAFGARPDEYELGWFLPVFGRIQPASIARRHSRTLRTILRGHVQGQPAR